MRGFYHCTLMQKSGSDTSKLIAANMRFTDFIYFLQRTGYFQEPHITINR